MFQIIEGNIFNAKENNYHHGNMYDLINGKRKSAHGIISIEKIIPDSEV